MKKTEKTFFDGEKCALSPSLEAILSRLPLELAAQIGMVLSSHPKGWEGLGEIRLRRERPSTLTVWGQTVPLAFQLGREAFGSIVDGLCGGAIYAHREEIRHGYVSVGGGVRIREGAAVFPGARIVPRIEIGEGSVVGIGSTVVRSVDPGTTVFGVPARRLEMV